MLFLKFNCNPSTRGESTNLHSPLVDGLQLTLMEVMNFIRDTYHSDDVPLYLIKSLKSIVAPNRTQTGKIQDILPSRINYTKDLSKACIYLN